MSCTNNAFDVLLERWNHHQDLRRSGADVATLFQSRVELDSARRMAGSLADAA